MGGIVSSVSQTPLIHPPFIPLALQFLAQTLATWYVYSFMKPSMFSLARERIATS